MVKQKRPLPQRRHSDDRLGRLREGLLDQVEETGHDVIQWIPLTSAAALALILDIARSRWLPDSDELWVLMLKAAFAVAEGGSLLTMVGPRAVEALGNLAEILVVRYQRVRARLQGRDPNAGVQAEEP